MVLVYSPALWDEEGFIRNLMRDVAMAGVVLDIKAWAVSPSEASANWRKYWPSP